MSRDKPLFKERLIFFEELAHFSQRESGLGNPASIQCKQEFISFLGASASELSRMHFMEL
jgi:hypothetical protein